MPLDSRQRGAVLGHLLNMSEEDRTNRFSAVASDDYIRNYVDGIGFARDIVLGALHSTRLVGMVHGAVYIERGDLVTEIGISVDAGVRKTGLGRRLLMAVMEFAKRFRVVRAYVLFRSDNSAMAALARAIGARIERDGNESSAVFELNPSAGVPVVSRSAQRGGDVLQVTHPNPRGRALLVHGAGGDSYQWASGMIPSLYQAGYSVCAPTLPGHGRGYRPTEAQLQGLLDCVASNAESFEPDVIVGHSMGGYLVQRHLETSRVKRAVLLASLPPSVPVQDDLGHVKAELHCTHSRAVIDSALPCAPNVDVESAGQSQVTVIGGLNDRVVPTPWVRYTARRYGVEPTFLEGGHRLMMGRAAAAVSRAIAA